MQRIFQENRPGGTTNLAGVLTAAFDEWFRLHAKPVTYLVVTDGAPDNEDDVKQAITSASNRLEHETDMSITVIQIGDDQGAAQFLHVLDAELECKFDIVDTIHYNERLGFEAQVESLLS